MVSHFSAGPGQQLETLALGGLLRLREMLRRSQAPRRMLPRSTQEVLRDFRLALAGLDRQAAEGALRYLTENLRLDALNLAYLQVQVDARFEEWAVLLQRPSFASLVEARRPPAVSAALVEAMYRVYLEPSIAKADADGAVAAFQREVQPRAGSLFRGQPQVMNPAVGTTFLLAALGSGRPDATALEPVLTAAQHWPVRDAAFIQVVLERVARERATVVAPVPVIAPLFGTDYDLHRQFEMALTAEEPTLDQARAVLLTAVQLQSLEAYQDAANYVERLPVHERETLLASPGLRGLWLDIAPLVRGGVIPHSWLEWLQELAQMDFNQALSTAEAGVAEWPVAEQLARPEDVSQLATALQSAPEDRLRDILPLLVDWLRSDRRYPNADHDPLYGVLLTQLLLCGRQTTAALSAVQELFVARLSLTPSSREYELMLREIIDVAGDLVGTYTVNWLLDLAEFTVRYPCANAGARSTFWTSLLALLQPFESRLSRSQLALARDLAMVLGGKELVDHWDSTAPAASLTPAPRFTYVAIYCLREEISQRVKLALEAEFPGMRIELNSEEDNSPRLRDLARRAELFVVCWQAALHAATVGIQAARPKELPTIFPSRLGTASIVEEIRQALVPSALPAVA
jgi:hypothetical protein